MHSKLIAAVAVVATFLSVKIGAVFAAEAQQRDLCRIGIAHAMGRKIEDVTVITTDSRGVTHLRTKGKPYKYTCRVEGGYILRDNAPNAPSMSGHKLSYEIEGAEVHVSDDLGDGVYPLLQ